MKTSILTILIFTFTALPLFGQLYRHNLIQVKKAIYKFSFVENFEVEGSPFYNENWKPGYAILKSGDVSNLHHLKYDIFQNRLLLRQNDMTYLVPPKTIKGFAFVEDGQRTVFKNGFTSGEYDINAEKYLKIIYDGEIKLAVKYRIDRNENLDVFSGETTVNFDRDKWYFLVTPDDIFHEVELNEDDILETLDNHQNQLKKYAEKNDLSFDDAEELKKILTYYDTLASGEN